MQLKQITERITSALRIAELNPMQRAVAAAKARQLVLLAPTGSGKTVAFAIGLLSHLSTDRAGNGTMAVVIAPSRELVMQIHSVLRPLASPPFKVTAMYGGNSFRSEAESAASRQPDIIVATPGRLLDHINRGTVSLDNATSVVIDEYDKTLELGFAEELRRIMRRMRNCRRLILTSATQLPEIPPYIHADQAEVLDFTDSGSAAKPKITVMNVPSPERDKLDTLAALLAALRGGKSMVFVNHRESAERVVESLRRRGIAAVLYHGGMEQRMREIAVASLRAGAAPVLVCTDLAARGLDIDAVDAVVHYHQPTSAEAWTHRNGRTARAGATGNVYVITGPDENVPEYVVTDHDWYPDPEAAQAQAAAPMTMLYFNVGRRDKVSRGDIAGFIMKQCGVPASDAGLITVGLDYCLAAVSPAYAHSVINAAQSGARVKNKRVRITEI